MLGRWAGRAKLGGLLYVMFVQNTTPQEAGLASSSKRRRFVTYPTQLRAAIQKQLPAGGLELISTDQRVCWSDRLLVTAVLLLTWLPTRKMREAFAPARENIIAMYPTRKRPGQVLGGFLKAWRQRSETLLTCIMPSLRQRTIARAGHAFIVRAGANATLLRRAVRE